MQELLDSKQRGRERLSRVQRSGAAARDHTGSGGFEAVEREEAALLSSWEQWERGALQTRAGLETSLSQIASSEQEFSVLSSRLGQDLHDFGAQLHDCRLRLAQCEGKHSGEECVKAWQLAKVCFRLSAFKQARFGHRTSCSYVFLSYHRKEGIGIARSIPVPSRQILMNPKYICQDSSDLSDILCLVLEWLNSIFNSL